MSVREGVESLRQAMLKPTLPTCLTYYTHTHTHTHTYQSILLCMWLKSDINLHDHELASPRTANNSPLLAGIFLPVSRLKRCRKHAHLATFLKSNLNGGKYTASNTKPGKEVHQTVFLFSSSVPCSLSCKMDPRIVNEVFLERKGSGVTTCI